MKVQSREGGKLDSGESEQGGKPMERKKKVGKRGWGMPHQQSTSQHAGAVPGTEEEVWAWWAAGKSPFSFKGSHDFCSGKQGNTFCLGPLRPWKRASVVAKLCDCGKSFLLLPHSDSFLRWNWFAGHILLCVTPRPGDLFLYL